MVDPGIGRTFYTSILVFSLKSWVITNKSLCRDDFCNTGNTCTLSSNYFSMRQTHTSSAVSQGLFTLEVKVRSEPHKKSTGQGKILSHNLSSFCLLLCVLSFFSPCIIQPTACLPRSINPSFPIFIFVSVPKFSRTSRFFLYYQCV